MWMRLMNVFFLISPNVERYFYRLVVLPGILVKVGNHARPVKFHESNGLDDWNATVGYRGEDTDPRNRAHMAGEEVDALGHRGSVKDDAPIVLSEGYDNVDVGILRV